MGSNKIALPSEEDPQMRENLKNMPFLVIFLTITPLHIFFPNITFLEWLMPLKLHIMKENGGKNLPLTVCIPLTVYRVKLDAIAAVCLRR